jgi:hypothetical protein
LYLHIRENRREAVETAATWRHERRSNIERTSETSELVNEQINCRAEPNLLGSRSGVARVNPRNVSMIRLDSRRSSCMRINRIQRASGLEEFERTTC